MELSEGIRKIGFRRWYERELIASHLYLVTCLLSAVAAFACVEGFSLRAPMPEPLIRAVLMAAAGWAAAWSLVRYLVMLNLANRAAERSVCRQCSTSGRLEVLGVRGLPRPAEAGLTLAPVRVRCRACGNEWTIE